MSISFTACSSNNTQQSNLDSAITVEDAEDTSKKIVFSYLGNDYPVNVYPDFDVKYMYHEDDEEENTCWVVFASDDADKLDDLENYDFSNGAAQYMYYLYNCRYNDLFSGNAEILGAYSYSVTGRSSSYGFDGWQIIYASDGDIVFKTTADSALECGLQEVYYDNNDNIIAKYSGFDEVNDNERLCTKCGAWKINDFCT